MPLTDEQTKFLKQFLRGGFFQNGLTKEKPKNMRRSWASRRSI